MSVTAFIRPLLRACFRSFLDMPNLTSHVQALKDELAKAQKVGASSQGRSLSNKENEVSN